jgi:NTE family protein
MKLIVSRFCKMPIYPMPIYISHIAARIVWIFVICLMSANGRLHAQNRDVDSINVQQVSDALLKKIMARPTGTRPKIGVTLSGGGAKGLAHIGILKAIDSAGLKISYITGTSMGSVVGGLYAAGYSGDSIESIARGIDWSLLFSNSPKLSSVSIEEKDEFNKYALEIPFEKGKFKIGKGIIEGQELWMTFAELFHPVYNITDFSQLSIPFKCIGTDLSTGNAVVMDKGNIITAIRGSMAIPSLFTPIRYDGKIIADGGMVNNFPVLDVKEMGADYVIGVNLNNGLTKAEDLENMFDVLLQLAFFKDASTFEKHKGQCDVYIQPDLKNYSTGSFSDSSSIIGIGNDWGKLYYPIFKRLADTLNALYPNEDTFKKDRLPTTKDINISGYTVEGLNKTTEKFFFGLSGLNTAKKFTYAKHADAIEKIYGSRYYKKINYDFLNDGSGNTTMHFNVEEYPLTAIKFGINYNTYTKLNLIANATSRDLIFKESRSTGSVSVSENPRLFLEFYKFIGKDRKFILNLSYYTENVDFPVYQDFSLLETVRSRYKAADVRAQHNISKSAYLGLSQQYNISVIKTPTINVLDLKGDNRFWHSYLSYRLNTLDKKYFTAKGRKLEVDAGYIYNQKGSISLEVADGGANPPDIEFDTRDMIRFYASEENYTPVNPKFVFFRTATLATLFNKKPYLPNSFQVGGIGENVVNQIQFAGLYESQVRTGSILAGQVGLQWKFLSSTYLTGRINLAVYDFYGVPFNTLHIDSNFLSGYALTVGTTSPLGPIEISAMYSDQSGKVIPNLNLGYRF